MSAGNAGGRLSLLVRNGIDSGKIFGIIVDIRCWLTLSRTMEGGGAVAHLHMRIDELMEATGRSKNQAVSYTHLLAEHMPFDPKKESTPKVTVVEKMQSRVMVADTDKGRELAGQIADLKELVAAYREGTLKERVE